MSAKHIYLPPVAILLFSFVLGGTLSVAIMLLTKPVTAAIPSLQARNAAPNDDTPTATDTPTCTPPTWSVTSSSNVGMGDNFLYGVATASASDIWAVGYSCGGNCSSGDLSQTLIEHWDGSAWNIVPSPNMGAGNNTLLGAAVVAPNEVWAVGIYTVGAVSRTLIERWDGSVWSVVASPNVGTGSNNLTGVAAVSDSDVWTVGYYDNGGVSQTLTEHWNGTSWTVFSSPNPGSMSQELKGVCAVGANDVWAVGSYRGDTNITQTLIEHWNGNAWSVVASPNVGSSSSFFNAAAATSANDAWAVGYYVGTIRQTLIEHWDGSAWSVVASPNPGTSLNRLNGVTAVSANDAWAMGYYNSSSPYQTFVLHWTCGTWSAVPSPNEAGYNYLIGATASAADAWAVGYYYNGGTYQTLVEHRYGASCPCPSPTDTPVVTPTPTACPMNFSDVQPSDYFYTAVRYLYCAGVISGYSNNMFLPSNNTTRGQLCKIVVLAKGWPVDCPSTVHFTDVPTSNVFFCFVETAYEHSLVSGYADGSFGVGNDVTRAQLCKIIVQAQQWPIDTTSGPHFTDVAQTNPFYGFIETAYNHGVVSGYANGTFAPGNSATRGQICKIVYQATIQP